MNEKLISVCLGLMLLQVAGPVTAQTVLTLDECREMALERNSESRTAQEKLRAAGYDRKAAVANYLPKVSVMGGYMHNSDNIKLISDEQSAQLSQLGTGVSGQLAGFIQQMTADPTFLTLYANDPSLRYMIGALSQADIATPLNQIGSSLAESFTLDVENVYAGVLTVQEPLFAGGKIRAYSKVTQYAEELAEIQLDGAQQKVMVTVDEAYWQIVSIANKLRLADRYVELLGTMESNVEKMKNEGVATVSDQLAVRVRLNEAEMSQIKARNGLLLSKMLLCQLCGLDLETEIVLADEARDIIDIPVDDFTYTGEDIDMNRPELKSLELAVKMYEGKADIVRADFLPTVALTGNYILSNPSMKNGFENKTAGMWNVGAVAKIPVFHFGEGMNKYRRAKSDAILAQYQLDDARGKVNLQISQYEHRIDEAESRMAIAEKTMENAEENLRMANIGFAEGVVESSVVLAANAAWLKAHSEEIDARIDCIMSKVYLRQAVGMLNK